MNNNKIFVLILCSIFMVPSMALAQEYKPKFDTQYRDKAKKYGIAAVVLMAVGGITEGIREKKYKTNLPSVEMLEKQGDFLLGVGGVGLMAVGIGCGAAALCYFVKDVYTMIEYKLYLLEQKVEKTKSTNVDAL